MDGFSSGCFLTAKEGFSNPFSWLPLGMRWSFRSRPLGSRTTAPPGPAAVTGVEKRAAKWLVELQNKAVRLDREVFGVQQPALGPFQRRLQEIGGIEPLVFGQYGELSESFEGLIDTLAVKGCDQAADHYLLDVGPAAASVQKRLLRQRVSCCVARAQAGVLLRRLKFALPGWAAAESRRGRWERESAQRAAQARAFSGEGHSEEWAFFFGAPH